MLQYALHSKLIQRKPQHRPQRHRPWMEGRSDGRAASLPPDTRSSTPITRVITEVHLVKTYWLFGFWLRNHAPLEGLTSPRHSHPHRFVYDPQQKSSKPLPVKLVKLSCLVERALLNDTVILLPLSEIAKSPSKSIRFAVLPFSMALPVPDADVKLSCFAASCVVRVLVSV